ncbi:MAG TPA: TlpA disulfide reductase family protein [Terriglobales bacterium]
MSIAAIVFAVVVTAAFAVRHGSMPEAHAASGAMRASDFALRTIDGTTVRLSDYKGKVVLLDFWATWCAPCKQEIPRFIEWQRRYGPQGFQVIGLSLDDTAGPVQKYARSIGINYPVALANEQVATQYGGILGVPVNFVIARDGTIVAKHVGETDLPKLEQELISQLKKAK